ncbi:MAG: septum formation initiator family protein [Bacteroidales bacterium]|jgi:cell division protein FtsB|nr:septum formation initiator family protein [Bacteroidales bacterium]
MGKIKDIFTGEHRKFAWFVVISTSLFLLSWLIGPGNTIIHWVKARNEISSQEKQMEVYRAQIDEMNQNIEELENNRDTLEKFARERFHFAAPGEDVYVIED